MEFWLSSESSSDWLITIYIFEKKIVVDAWSHKLKRRILSFDTYHRSNRYRRCENKLTVTNTPTIVKRNPQMPNAVLPYYMPPFRSPNHSTNKEE